MVQLVAKLLQLALSNLEAPDMTEWPSDTYHLVDNCLGESSVGLHEAFF